MEDRLLEIGKRIAMIRKSKGLTQRELGDMTGKHPNYISYIERGVRNYQVKMLITLADALNVPIEMFFEKTPPVTKQRMIDKKGINELTLSGRWVGDVIPFFKAEKNMEWMFMILVSGSHVFENDHVISIVLRNSLKEHLIKYARLGDYLKIQGKLISNWNILKGEIESIQIYVIAENIFII